MMKKKLLIIIFLCLGMSLAAQTWQVGDLYTAPDGSQGVVFYLNPDGSGGWIVALEDASEGCAWGAVGDVVGLPNYSSSQYSEMMNDTAGFTYTQTILAQTADGVNSAAGVVDYSNGWYLPTPFQLRLLYARLPLVSPALLAAGGSDMAFYEYWSSAEYNATSAWYIAFGYTQGNTVSVNSGGVYSANKTSSCHVRAVRNFTSGPTYLWNTGATTSSITVSPEQTTEYTVTVSMPNGVSYTDSITIEVGRSSSSEFHVVTIFPYTWDGVTYDQSGSYTHTYTTVEGCDSTVTLILTMIECTHGAETVTACESYDWHGETYTATGVYTYAYTNADSCAIVDTLHLTVNHGTHNVTDTTVCESYTWHGETYTITGTYTYAYTNAASCPSVDTLHLTVNYITRSTLFDTVVENALPYVLNDSSYMQSGIYQQTLANMAGCDSLLTLHLTVLNNVFTSVDSIVCASALPLVWNGVTFTEAGVYYDTLTAANGADSVVAMTLQVIPLPVISYSPDLTVPPCSTVTLWASGADFLTWTDADGNLLGGGETLTVAPVQSSATYYISGFNEGVVEDMNVVINGDFEQGNTSFTSAYRYSTSLGPEGTYYVDANAHDHHGGFTGAHDHTNGSGLYMMVNGAGTPNTVIWQQTVTVQPNTSYAFSVWVNTLSPYSEQYLSRLQFSINGEQIGEVFRSPLTLNTWSQFYQVWYSGTNSQATITILNQNTALAGNDFGIDDISFVPLVACYSTDSVHVEVLGVTDTTILTETACDFFVWYGDTLTETGEYPHTLINEGGCDSVVTLHLTVNYVSDSTINVSVMEDALPYILNGESYDTSGTYYQTLTNASGCDSLLTIVLSVITTFLPDNVDSANCVFFPDGTEWGIQTAWQSENIVSVLNTPLVGDLDGDGIPEIVCFARDGDNSTGDPRCNNHLLVFDGRSKAIKASIILPSYVSGFDAAAYGLVRLPNGPGLIVVACFDYKLRAYDISAANPSVPYWVSDIDFGESGHDWAVNVSFADFNHDGHPEVYVRNKIYNAETGTLLVTANTTTHYGASYAHWTNTGAHPYKLSSPIAADVCGDVKLDLILGNEVYDVNINNLAGTLGNSITLAQRVTPPGDAPEDGHPQVADFNHDGYLDVFVSVRNTYESVGYVYGYVWDIHNQTVSAPFVIRTGWSGKSIPLIADIDNDNLMEVLIQSEVSWDPNKFQAYKYHPDTRTFTLEWGFPTDENSYSNSITAFDFNQDGLLELMISDQNTMRIVNGSGISHITHADTIPMYVLNSFPFSQNTIMQYPVIADVDADGSAEIVSVGSDRLNILKSSTSVPWAPARKVWNQYMYNVTNVNEDLTIPQYLFNNATVFTDPEGVVRRPFNNFLQQATTIDQYGRPFYAVPDVAVNQTVSIQANGDSLLLSFSYCNLGDNTLNAPYTITVFANAYGEDTVCTVTMNESLPVDSCTQGEIRVSVGSLCSFQSLDNLVIAVNGNGGGIAQNGDLQPECDTTNNVVTIAFSLYADTTYVTETACDIFDWYEHVGITQSGDYTHVFTDAAGCDSVVILHLTVFHSTHHVLDTTVCESFTWDEGDGATYTVTGTYTYDYTNTEGCASVDTLHLTILHGTHHVLDTTVCESYTWTEGDGVTYTASGTYTYEYTNAEGCASADTLLLTVNYGTHNVTDTTACENYTWHGNTYTTTGTYTYSYTNGDGCPSVDTLHLTVGTPTESTISVTVLENNLPFTLNDSSYTLPGTYYQHFTNAAGCDSMLTIVLTVYYNQTVEVDSTVCESALPITWNNVTFTQAGTLSDTLTTSHGADSIVVMTLNVLPSPEAVISGLVALCSDSVVTLTADSAYSYLWSTGDTTRIITVTGEGAYTLTVTNEYGCTATATHYLMPLGNPIISVTVPEMCAGGSYLLSVGFQPDNNIHLGQGATTLSLTDTIYLPDGVYCEPFGCSYRSPLTFTAYADGDTIQTADDIYYVRLNMEHSFVGDLYINITCPNGQKADLLKYGGSGNSSCNSQIVSSSRGWAAGSNCSVGNYFGEAYDYDVSSCDATAFGNEPGVGWNYCWSDNTTQGYVYAPGEGSLIYRSVNAHSGRIDSSNVASGTQFYHPDDSFNNLIGCPLNGSWYIEVQDGWSSDNGYIFGWELSLSNEMLPDVTFELDYSTAAGPWVTTLSDTLFQVDPPADLAHDTTIAYTFTVYDTTGCGYDTTIYITFYATPHAEFDTMVCGSFTWNDNVYTQSGQYVQHLASASGCDSVVTCQLTVGPLASTYDTLTLLENQLPYDFALANTTFTMQSPLVSSTSYTLTSSQGCDSVVLVTVYIYHNVATQVDTTVCAASLPITWHGHSYTAAGSFTTTLLTTNGADSVVTYTLTVDEVAATVPTVTHVTCYGGNNGAATATVTGGMPNFAYAWTNAEGASVSTSTSISNQPAGTYTFTVTDMLGCTATATVTLNTLNGELQPGTIAEDQDVCEGELPLPFTGTAASGGDNGAYQWQMSTNGTDWTAAPGTNNAQNYTYPNVPTAGFSLRRAWVSQSCGTVYSNIVTISLWPNSSDTIEGAVCIGDVYQENGFNITADQTAEAGVYTFEQHFATGHCDSMVVLVLTVNPHYEIELEDVVCEGDGYHDNGFSISPLETVGEGNLTRTLTLHTAAGCDSVVTLHLRVIDTAVSIVSLTPDFCENLTAELMVVTDMPNYEWSTGETAPSITVTQSGRYYVTATSGDCSSTAHITVESCDGNQLLLPNAITPSNHDGLNDYFSIPERNLLYINLFEIWIYNRWGELVYYSNDKNFHWNGEYRDKIQYGTVYNYIIRYTNAAGKREFVKGSVTVL